MTLQTQHASVLKQLKAHVKDLNREHRYLSSQLEKATRYAGGGSNKVANKLEREVSAIEKLMSQIEKVTKKFPNDDLSF